MANQWFRMYSEFLTDPKVQRLSEQDQRRYIMILCMRCNVTKTDDVTLHETLCNENVTFMLRISNDEWLLTQKNLIDKGLIDSGNIPTAWDKRQYVSDSSAERVRRHRENAKNTSKNNAKTEKKCNVTVTPPDTETNTDTNTEVKEIDKSISRTRFQKPTKNDIHNFCKQEQIVIDADKFIDHYEANGWIVGKTKMKDWQATVRNWARRNNEFSPNNPRASPLKPERPKYTYTPSHLSDMKEIHGERLL